MGEGDSVKRVQAARMRIIRAEGGVNGFGIVEVRGMGTY